MVLDGGSRRFLLICLNYAVKSFAVAMIMSMKVQVGMMSFWGNQEPIFPIRTELLAVIQL